MYLAYPCFEELGSQQTTSHLYPPLMLDKNIVMSIEIYVKVSHLKLIATAHRFLSRELHSDLLVDGHIHLKHQSYLILIGKQAWNNV